MTRVEPFLSLRPVGEPPSTSTRIRRLRASTLRSGRSFSAGFLVYLTNHIVSHVPNRALRQGWYRQVVGLDLARDACVQLGTQLWFYGPGQIRRSPVSIGCGTRINQGSILDCRGGLTIGDHVSISPQVAILTADHDRDARDFPLRHRPVVIEDNVWIGVRALILPGVRVGRAAVVAAGAVVTRDVAPGSVVAGAPAKWIAARDAKSIDYQLNERPAPFE